MGTHLSDGQIPRGWRSAAARLALAVLIAGALATVATKANSNDGSVAAAAADAVLPAVGVPSHKAAAPDVGDVGPFAFGYIEFDWDPRAPGGVPGFDSWPPGAARR